MLRLKPLILFLLCGLAYPATQFGWAREALLETILGPIHVLWAFALGLGGLAAITAGRSREASLGFLLAMGYGVSGALWAVGPPRLPGGTIDVALILVLLWGLIVLGAVWILALRSLPRILPGAPSHPAPGLPVSEPARVKP